MKHEPKHLLFSADGEENATRHTPCLDCGAPAGEPCFEPPQGRKIHQNRYLAYVDWIKAYHKLYREQCKDAA